MLSKKATKVRHATAHFAVCFPSLPHTRFLLCFSVQFSGFPVAADGGGFCWAGYEIIIIAPFIAPLPGRLTPHPAQSGRTRAKLALRTRAVMKVLCTVPPFTHFFSCSCAYHYHYSPSLVGHPGGEMIIIQTVFLVRLCVRQSIASHRRGSDREKGETKGGKCGEGLLRLFGGSNSRWP